MENRIDIKSLLAQNDVKLNNNQRETDMDEILGKKPEGFDPSKIEGSSADNGFAVETSEVISHGGIKGGGVAGNLISAEQMSAIEETLKELDESTEKAKAEFDAWNKKQKEENDAKKFDNGRPEIQDGDSLSIDDEPEEDSIVDGSETGAEFKKRYEEAVVVIDKTGMGQVINFTDE